MSRPITVLFAAALFAHPASGLSLARVGGVSTLHQPPRPCNPPTHVIASRRQRNQRLGALRSGAPDEDVGRDSDAGGALVEAGAAADAPQQPSPSVASGGRRTDDQSLARALSLLGTSPRRIFLSLLSSTFIALAANLFGVTSALLAALPEEVSETTGLDSFYPRGGYKRVTVRGGGGAGAIGGGGSSAKCSFLIPKEWVADTGLALAQARRRAVPLDYAMGSEKSNNVLPDAAYGPPGRLDDRGLSNGDTNVSVIVNTDVKQFSLASLGNGPREAAEKLYGSRRNIQMESAVEQTRGSDNVPVYQFEYTVDRGERAKPLRAISVVAGSVAGDAFVTLTVVSPADAWEDPFVSERLRRVAESFKLV